MKYYEPAFPRPASIGNNYLTGETDVVVDPQIGMTLRDYFAAKAMQIYGNPTMAFDQYEIAKAAYELADKMLKVREENA
jgi:hypothetical protein